MRHADVWLGNRRVLQGIDWRLREGEHWRIEGPNGAGKSTFLRLLHGQLRPALGGGISFPGLGDPASVWAVRRRIGWVSAELQAGYGRRTTVADCVASGFRSTLGLVTATTAEERLRVGALLEQFELTQLSARRLAELSYGQARRVLLARALVHRPRVLLLDEPWEGLDVRNAMLLAARLRSVVEDGTQLICASHVAIAEERYTHTLVLEAGRCISARPCERAQGTVRKPGTPRTPERA